MDMGSMAMPVTWDFHDKVIVVHAVIACIAVLGTAPAAILLARYMREDRRWFNYHRALNTATVLLIVITFALGTAAVYSQGQGRQFSGDQADLHHDLGLGLFIVVCLQGIGGILAHATGKNSNSSGASKPSGGKTYARWAHILAGIVLMGLLIAEAWIGFTEWNTMQSTGTFTPDAVRYIFLIIVAFEVGAYLYQASCATLLKTAGDDGRGPWARLDNESNEKAVLPALGNC
ncbi:MAG: hypothetical protein TREMPRED_001968 [Tremellales sp. Tagirdzhanova-0007]|nr:MAG: hypothetical protein TREMPRED_001968 [Tremellales sp. Tagirdzhanova-0007]